MKSNQVKWVKHQVKYNQIKWNQTEPNKSNLVKWNQTKSSESNQLNSCSGNPRYSSSHSSSPYGESTTPSPVSQTKSIYVRGIRGILVLSRFYSSSRHGESTTRVGESTASRFSVRGIRGILVLYGEFVARTRNSRGIHDTVRGIECNA